MATHRTTWNSAERRAASLFGARRQPLSGSSGRDDITRSDTNHPRLFVEAKYRERHSVRTLYDATKALALKEGKIPVLALIDKGRHGFLICVHSNELSAVAAEIRANENGIPSGDQSSRPRDCSERPLFPAD